MAKGILKTKEFKQNSLTKVVSLPKEKPSLREKIFTGVKDYRNALLGSFLVLLLTVVLSPETEPFYSYFFTKVNTLPEAYRSTAIWMTRLGIFFLSALLIYIFYLDIRRYKPSLAVDTKKLIAVGILLAGTVLIGKFTYYLLGSFADFLGIFTKSTIIYGIPIAAGAMLVALLFDMHLAIVFSFIIALISGIWIVEERLYPIFAFVGSIAASFGVLRCRKRSSMLIAGMWVGVANLFTITCIDLYKGTLFSATGFFDLAFGFGNAIVIYMIVSGLLPLFETVFKITTDIKLLELLDLNQPIMRNLLVVAPGTYHHSIIVGNLSEAAAEAVGVNPLLARVSSYYHDIGKIKMPEYFIENQSDINKHDKLSPSMSSLILASHVKEGVELAAKHGLPEVVTDIIQQHHGTSLMRYFYQKAREQWDASQPPLSEDDYRYHGPKPQSRVAAVVMLADEVEAASRVLTDPTPARINALVNKVVTNIFIDGQLNECELTLKDLHEIAKSFNKVLTGIFHHRIAYPSIGLSAYKKKGRYADRDHKHAAEAQGEYPETEKDRQEDIDIRRISYW